MRAGSEVENPAGYPNYKTNKNKNCKAQKNVSFFHFGYQLWLFSDQIDANVVNFGKSENGEKHQNWFTFA